MEPTAQAGWNRVEVSDRGFAISLPQGWETFDLTSDELSSLMDPVTQDPNVAPFADQITQLLASGGALWAVNVDARSARAGFATNVNVIVQDSGGVPLDPLVAASVSFMEQTLSTTVEQRKLTLPAGPAVEVTGELENQAAGRYHISQFYLVHDDMVYIVTFSRAIGAEFDDLEDTFSAAMQTFEFVP